ncbi:hypothetical protein [Anaeromicropila populeti]|uniref:Uncharacterized protein n=1 Tax=Anaeromicropila populeti TaxID=37658 RepID=A0A1I6KA53_9FIRM|nr:hypothetical protein [Anaeromicropila populeti]SFR88024.1 hypothetical protein SAMN05661086_02310 [Anaeromicropila populeti]
MTFEYLKNFSKRMEKIGAYAQLFKTSIGKLIWKQYDFNEFYEQTNLIFTILLYIMEQSLKEEICTMDDIADFIDQVNSQWFQKAISYEQCKELGNFVVNSILCNEGKAMYFKGYDYEASGYRDIYISFVGNRIAYEEGDVKRTTYYLTDEGYNLMLSTLEIDSNLRLTVHEMIFKLHLEKATYDQAVDDIKRIFDLLRIQLQKIQETMRRIRQNALSYSVEDYRTVLEENLDVIKGTKKKFAGYQNHIKERIRELEEKDININKLGKEEEKNLNNLKIIEGYLERALDEHQKILGTHFDLKDLYTKELESLSQMALIRRFHMREEVYDRVLKDVSLLERMDLFLRPLFQKDWEKTYNLNKALELQKPIYKKKNEDEDFISIEEEDWQEAQLQEKLERLKKYKKCLWILLWYAAKAGGTTLKKIKEEINEEEREFLLPSVEIFKEVMIELIQSKEISLDVWRKERKENLAEEVLEFQLSTCVIELLDENPELSQIKNILIYRLEDEEQIVFDNVMSESGGRKRIKCSNVCLRIE